MVQGLLVLVQQGLPAVGTRIACIGTARIAGCWHSRMDWWGLAWQGLLAVGIASIASGWYSKDCQRLVQGLLVLVQQGLLAFGTARIAGIWYSKDCWRLAQQCLLAVGTAKRIAGGWHGNDYWWLLAVGTARIAGGWHDTVTGIAGSWYSRRDCSWLFQQV